MSMGITATRRNPWTKCCIPQRIGSRKLQCIVLVIFGIFFLALWMMYMSIGIISTTTASFRRSREESQIPLFLSMNETQPLRIRNQITLQSLSEEMKQAKAYLASIKSFDRGQSLQFLHIPKTAGTAVEEAGGMNSKVWGSCRFHHTPKRKICAYPASTPLWPQAVGWWHLPSQFFPLAQANPYHNSEMFAVVRDSYERMVSEYYYVCTLKVWDWRPDQCNRTRLDDATYMNEWIQKKLTVRPTQRSRDYLEDNGHFTSQSEFIMAPFEVRRVDYVLRQDDLASDFNALMKAFGLDQIQIPKMNAIGAVDRNKSGKSLTVENLNAETIKSINMRFRGDFDLGFTNRRPAT